VALGVGDAVGVSVTARVGVGVGGSRVGSKVGGSGVGGISTVLVGSTGCTDVDGSAVSIGSMGSTVTSGPGSSPDRGSTCTLISGVASKPASRTEGVGVPGRPVNPPLPIHDPNMTALKPHNTMIEVTMAVDAFHKRRSARPGS
jgi:hypothetical protein